MQWSATAPSNIALIKYMGKSDESRNIASNPSLSYTLNALTSTVELRLNSKPLDQWQPLPSTAYTDFELSDKAKQRFINHLRFLKQGFDFQGNFLIRSNNNFPMGTGLASSASSFAALTKCAVTAFTELTNVTPLPISGIAKLSRQGSGSSCRSFFTPWALWEDTEISAIKLPYRHLIHQIILVDNKEKEISSSKAHKLVLTSPNFKGRTTRASQNLDELMSALNNKDWKNAYQICWREFMDMHELFHTATPSFSYMTEATKLHLAQLQNLWEEEGDGPIITMDAGPNIHLLFREDQAILAQRYQDIFSRNRCV